MIKRIFSCFFWEETVCFSFKPKKTVFEHLQRDSQRRRREQVSIKKAVDIQRSALAEFQPVVPPGSGSFWGGREGFACGYFLPGIPKTRKTIVFFVFSCFFQSRMQ